MLMRSFAFLVILFVLLTVSCGKESQPEIPYVYVDRLFYPNSLDYIPVGGYIYADEGFRGIIIYRMMTDEFRIFECCCPYDPEKSTARVEVEVSGVTAVDSTCMSKYILLDGSPFEGPSPYSLKQYRYNFDGEVLHVFN